MLKIEVTPEVKSRNVTSGAHSYVFRSQVAYCQLPGKKYPSDIVVPLPRDREPYPAGVYTISPDSFSTVTEYGETRMVFSLVLQPLPGKTS